MSFEARLFCCPAMIPSGATSPSSLHRTLSCSRHKEIKDIGYQHYDNYDAIEVPYTDAIPSDYDGVMGVPISFMDKYCHEQFEIVMITKTWYGGASKTYPEQIQVDRNGKESKVTKLNDGPVIKVSEPPMDGTSPRIGDNYYI